MLLELPKTEKMQLDSYLAWYAHMNSLIPAGNPNHVQIVKSDTYLVKPFKSWTLPGDAHPIYAYLWYEQFFAGPEDQLYLFVRSYTLFSYGGHNAVNGATLDAYYFDLSGNHLCWFEAASGMMESNSSSGATEIGSMQQYVLPPGSRVGKIGYRLNRPPGTTFDGPTEVVDVKPAEPANLLKWGFWLGENISGFDKSLLEEGLKEFFDHKSNGGDSQVP